MSLVMKELIKIGETALKKANCLDPKLDAELLMLYLLKVNKSQLFLKLPNYVDEKTCESYFELIDIRVSGKPVQYITGEQEFMGIRFLVNENVLIPRQDTETLVEQVIQYTKESKTPRGGFNILDLCCGSGAIGISLCKLVKDVSVTATDISPEALDVARKNAASAGVTKQIRFIESNLFSSIKKGFGGNKYNIIVSNPPYIKSEIISTLQREIVEYEPIMALDGGQDGLDFYRRIISEAPGYLKKGGMLMMETGFDQGNDIMSLIKDTGKYEDPAIIKDLSGRDRVVKSRLIVR